MVYKIIVPVHDNHTTWNKLELFFITNIIQGRKATNYSVFYWYRGTMKTSILYINHGGDFNKIAKRVCKNEARVFKNRLRGKGFCNV